MEKDIEKEEQEKELQQLAQTAEYFLGIGFKADTVQGMDYREVAVRIFLSPTISCKKVNAVVKSLETGKMSIDTFLKRTDSQILRLREQDEDDNIVDLMIDRIENWPLEFGFLLFSARFCP